jgi:hypothetical protein
MSFLPTTTPSSQSQAEFLRLGNYFINRAQISHIEIGSEFFNLSGSGSGLRQSGTALPITSITIYLTRTHETNSTPTEQNQNEVKERRPGLWQKLFGKGKAHLGDSKPPHLPANPKEQGYQLHFKGKQAQALYYWLVEHSVNLDEVYQEWEAAQFEQALFPSSPESTSCFTSSSNEQIPPITARPKRQTRPEKLSSSPSALPTKQPAPAITNPEVEAGRGQSKRKAKLL